jgi:MFS family permease
VSVIGGIYADLYSTSRARGVAIMAFMACTTWGPLAGPLISGYVSEGVSWQWVYWIELIVAGATWPFLLCMPETYGPVILKRKAKKMRKESGNSNIAAPSEVQKQDLWEVVSVVLTRPVRMFLFEAIVLCTCLYLSLAYGIFYSTFALVLQLVSQWVLTDRSILPGLQSHFQWHIRILPRSSRPLLYANRSRLVNCCGGIFVVRLVPRTSTSTRNASCLVAKGGVQSSAACLSGWTSFCTVQ